MVRRLVFGRLEGSGRRFRPPPLQVCPPRSLSGDSRWVHGQDVLDGLLLFRPDTYSMTFLVTLNLGAKLGSRQVHRDPLKNWRDKGKARFLLLWVESRANIVYILRKMARTEPRR